MKYKSKIWVISNTSENHIEKLKSKFNFLNQLDGIITSESAGFHKPHPQIFHFALDQSKTAVDNAIFIDDSYGNVESAENLGITAHHYTEIDTLLDFINIHL